MNPAVVPVYSECLRLCGSWLAESCLESPAIILEKYLEKVKRSYILQVMMGNKRNSVTHELSIIVHYFFSSVIAFVIKLILYEYHNSVQW